MTENGPIGQQELWNRVYKGPNKSGDNVDGIVEMLYGYDYGNSVWRRVATDSAGNVSITGGSGGTQYVDGDTVPANPTAPSLVYDNDGTWTHISGDNPLPVSATFSGSVTTSPTFAQNPGAGSPTPGYGLQDSSYRPVIVGAGTAGSQTGGILTVQGDASGTAIPVSGTFWQATQPVSGTVTANAGTNLNTSLLALESGGNLASIKTDSDSIVTNTSNIATNTTNIPNIIGTASSNLPSKGIVVQGSDYGGTAKAQTLKVDSSGNAQVAITNTPAVTVSGVATASNQTGGSQKTQIVDGSGNVIASTSNALNVDIINSSLAVTGTFYQSTQPVSIADGSDTTLGSKADAKSTATDTTAVTVMQVLKEISYMEQNPASRAVTNAGTFAVQATIGAGSALIGKVGIDQTTPGTTNAVAIQDGAGNALTSNSTTYTAKKALDANILGTLGTAFSTAGKVDVKGADGDVFVRQATASNLNATVVPGNSTGAAIPSVAVPAGFQARTSEQSALTSGDLYMPVIDAVGKQIVMPYANKENFTSGVGTATGTSGTSVISAPGASVKLYITSISIANTGSTTSLITIQQDPTGSPTTLWYMINPAGGGDNITFPVPLVVAANKAVGFTAGSSSSTQYVSISGYTGA